MLRAVASLCRGMFSVACGRVLGLFGLITAVIINSKMEAATYSAYS